MGGSFVLYLIFALGSSSWSPSPRGTPRSIPKSSGWKARLLQGVCSELAPDQISFCLLEWPQYESSNTYPYPIGLAGPEIDDVWGLSGPSYRKTNWKRRGAKPPTFSSGSCGRRDRLDPPNRRFPARPAPGDKDKFWSSHTNFRR